MPPALGAHLSSPELLPFAGRFVGARGGAAVVAGAQAEIRDEADEPYVLLSLSLAPPPPGQLTWSTDDMFELRQEVRRRLAASQAQAVVVSFVGGATPEEEPAAVNEASYGIFLRLMLSASHAETRSS